MFKRKAPDEVKKPSGWEIARDRSAFYAEGEKGIDLLTFSEIQRRYVGVGRNVVARLVDRGDIRVHMVGQRFKIARRDIVDYLNRTPPPRRRRKVA